MLNGEWWMLNGKGECWMLKGEWVMGEVNAWIVKSFKIYIVWKLNLHMKN